MKEGHISNLGTDGSESGLSPDEPIAIIQTPIVQVESPSIPDGRYAIKNRAAVFFWDSRGQNPIGLTVSAFAGYRKNFNSDFKPSTKPFQC